MITRVCRNTPTVIVNSKIFWMTFVLDMWRNASCLLCWRPHSYKLQSQALRGPAWPSGPQLHSLSPGSSLPSLQPRSHFGHEWRFLWRKSFLLYNSYRARRLSSPLPPRVQEGVWGQVFWGLSWHCDQLCGVSVALSIASTFYQLSIPLKDSIRGAAFGTDGWYSPVT